MSFQNVQRLIGPSPELYLQYTVIYAALSRYLNKNMDYVYAVTEASSKLFLKDKRVIKARDFRNLMTDMKYSQPCCVRFWLNKLGTDIDKTAWTLAKHTTPESRLGELHWKILHNIYSTNILLLKLGLVNNDKCQFCTDQIDFY